MQSLNICYDVWMKDDTISRLMKYAVKIFLKRLYNGFICITNSCFQNYEIFKNTSFLDERQQIILFYFFNIWEKFVKRICKYF